MKYTPSKTLLWLSLFAVAGCLELEDARAIGPVVRLTATDDSIEVSPGETASVSVQALDVNGVGVSGAWVTSLGSIRLESPGRKRQQALMPSP